MGQNQRVGVWSSLAECPLCAERDLVCFLTASDTHYRIAGQYQIDRCRRCGLVFLNPRPDFATLMALYPKDSYYAYHDPTLKPSPWKLAMNRWLLNVETRDPEFPVPGKVLDVGCGSGAFLGKMRAKGWEACGVEASPEAAETGSRHGLNIFAGTLVKAAFPDGTFDYVRLNHSLEHILDPNETLSEIRRILKPSGKLMIGVPNIDGATFRVFGRWWYYLAPPVHVFHYSPDTLSRLLRKHGFEPERIVYNSNYHGLLEGFQIFLNRGTLLTAGEGTLANSRVLRVLAHRAAKILDFLGIGDCIEITAHPR